jgi:hypothetical protein
VGEEVREVVTQRHSFAGAHVPFPVRACKQHTAVWWRKQWQNRISTSLLVLGTKNCRHPHTHENVNAVCYTPSVRATAARGDAFNKSALAVLNWDNAEDTAVRRAGDAEVTSDKNVATLAWHWGSGVPPGNRCNNTKEPCREGDANSRPPTGPSTSWVRTCGGPFARITSNEHASQAQQTWGRHPNSRQRAFRIAQTDKQV